MKTPKFSTVCDDALADLDGVALQKLLHTKSVSCTELTQAALSRLQNAEPLNAVALQCEVSAFKQAAQWDRDLNHGKARGLGGLPSVLKDNLDLAGYPTRHGSEATSSKAKKKSSGLTRQMEQAGLNWIAKSRLPEFGLTATTEYGTQSPARNPHNLQHSTGGSSGGSAALVAAGVVPIAHANDGGGSIRIPAACCGLVGLKPTRGRLLPNEMAKGLPVQIVSDGVVTRSVRDTIAFHVEAEKSFRNSNLYSFTTAYSHPLGVEEGVKQRLPVNKLRIGFFTEKATGGHVAPDVKAGVLHAAQLLESLGHHVEEIPLPVKAQFADDFLLYWGMLAASLRWGGRLLMGLDFQASRLETLTYHLANHFKNHIRHAPAAIRRLKAFEQDYAMLFSKYDLLLSSTLGTLPPPLGHLDLNLNFEEARARLFDFACYTAAQNVSGASAISLPLFQAQGLPVGIHLAAKKNDDILLTDLALQLEPFFV